MCIRAIKKQHNHVRPGRHALDLSSALPCRFQLIIIQICDLPNQETTQPCSTRTQHIDHRMTAHFVGQMFADHIDATPLLHPICARKQNLQFILIMLLILNFPPEQFLVLLAKQHQPARRNPTNVLFRSVTVCQRRVCTCTREIKKQHNRRLLMSTT